jgi:hypothetical protein
MTLDQALAHLEGKAKQWRHAAADSRRNGDEYKTAANDASDAHIRRVQFEESSRFYGYAREIDRDAEALEMVLGAAKESAVR